MSLKRHYVDIVPSNSKKESEIIKTIGITPPNDKDKISNGMPYQAIIKDLTPDQAFELLACHKYDGNRNVDEGWAEELMNANERDTEVSIGYVEKDKEYIMVNGHHGSLAAANKEKPSKFSFKAYFCKDKVDFAKLYNSFDSHKRRSYQASLSIYQNMAGISVVTDNGFEIPTKLLAQIGSSIREAKSGFLKKSMSNSKKVEDAISKEAIEFANFIGDKYQEFFNESANDFGRTAARILPNAILASFYAMKVSDENRASEFISDYFMQTMISPSAPANLLYRRIANRPKEEHAACSYKTFVRACHVCWKAFKEGRTDVKMEDLSVDALKNYHAPNYNQW